MHSSLRSVSVRGPIVSPYGTSGERFAPLFLSLSPHSGASKGYTHQASKAGSAYSTHAAPVAREQGRGMATVGI